MAIPRHRLNKGIQGCIGFRIRELKLSYIIPPIIENRMEKQNEHEMETGII